MDEATSLQGNPSWAWFRPMEDGGLSCEKTEDQRCVKLLSFFGHEAELNWHPDVLLPTPNAKLRSAPKVIITSTVISNACTGS